MAQSFRPRDTAELLEVVKWAAAEQQPLEVIGNGSKRALGRPVQVANTLALDHLIGVVDYEPAELVLTARAGTPLAEIQALLQDNGQELAFEPMDYGPVLGEELGRATFGGTLAANVSGPRRIKAGAARDHVLGLEAVSGRGELFRAGGRVVKNVTGYDLARAFCASWGTLAVASTITVKVAPRTAMEKTVCLYGLQGVEATGAMSAALGSSAEISGAAHVPEKLAAVQSGALGGGRSLTLLRLEGIEESIEYRVGILRRVFELAGPFEVMDAATSFSVWQSIRNLTVFPNGLGALWRVSVAPTAADDVIASLPEGCMVMQDWGGGLLWISDPDDQRDGTSLRATIASAGGGHATLVKAPPNVRNTIEVFHPQEPGLSLLTKRLKSQFDPHGVLNPGRMYKGV